MAESEPTKPRGGLSSEAEDAAREAAEAAGIPLGEWITRTIKTAGSEESSSAEGLTSEAQNAAQQAAQAAGLPLGAWITQAIREAGVPTAAVSQPAGAEQSGPASDAGTAETAPTEEEATDIQRWARYVPVGHMRAGRFQTRERMDSEEISALSESIRQRGILQPILVRRHPDIVSEYEIIAGERRWRAAQQAELSEAPVVVLDLTDHDAMEIALVENMQRRDLSALEEAKGFRRLIEDYSHTQDDLARAVGKSRSHIANTLRLIRLPGPVKNMLRDGQLTAGHARALLNARHPAALAREVVARGLNVRQTESLAQTTLTGQTETRPKPEKDGDILAIEQELSNLLGLRVRIHIRDDRGTVSIRFRGLQALGELVSRLQQTSES